ncbi:MAG: hypothetical protein LBV06_10995 [Propionibacteriaceae bacterium]|nr:hypothetical protein [Propionibacteriaceae bacterium]
MPDELAARTTRSVNSLRAICQGLPREAAAVSMIRASRQAASSTSVLPTSKNNQSHRVSDD